MVPSLILVLGLAGQVPTEAPPVWLAVDVVNPSAAGGHPILHLEDVLSAAPCPRSPLGGAAAGVKGMPQARALLLFGTDLEDCHKGGACARAAAIARDTRAKGGLVVGVVFGEKGERAVARGLAQRRRLPYPLTVDVYGLLRMALHLNRAGDAVVIDSACRLVRFSDSAEPMESARRVYLQTLRESREEE